MTKRLIEDLLSRYNVVVRESPPSDTGWRRQFSEEEITSGYVVVCAGREEPTFFVQSNLPWNTGRGWAKIFTSRLNAVVTASMASIDSRKIEVWEIKRKN